MLNPAFVNLNCLQICLPHCCLSLTYYLFENFKSINQHGISAGVKVDTGLTRHIFPGLGDLWLLGGHIGLALNLATSTSKQS